MVSQPSDGDDSSVQEYISSGDEEDTFISLKTYQAPNAAMTYSDGMCLEEGEYRFVIADIAGDGLCCEEVGRKGYYNVTSHGKTIAYGDAFGASETTTFKIQNTLCHEVEVNIAYDDYSGETSWLLERKVNEDHSHQVKFHHAKDGERSYLKTLCLDEGSYVFTMYDDADDGICCETTHHERQGSYSVALDGVFVANGGSFGQNETTPFEVVPDQDCHMLDVNIYFDDYSGEISYDIQSLSDQGDETVVVLYNAEDGLKTHAKSYCLKEGTYTYHIYDAAGDGMCCDERHELHGYYNVTLDGELISQGDDFGRNESTTFKVGNASE